MCLERPANWKALLVNAAIHGGPHADVRQCHPSTEGSIRTFAIWPVIFCTIGKTCPPRNHYIKGPWALGRNTPPKRAMGQGPMGYIKGLWGRAHGPRTLGPWAHESLGPWAHVPMGPRAHESMGSWALGRPCRWALYTGVLWTYYPLVWPHDPLLWSYLNEGRLRRCRTS